MFTRIRLRTGEYAPVASVALVTLGRYLANQRKARCQSDIGLFSWMYPMTKHGLVAETV